MRRGKKKTEGVFSFNFLIFFFFLGNSGISSSFLQNIGILLFAFSIFLFLNSPPRITEEGGIQMQIGVMEGILRFIFLLS